MALIVPSPNVLLNTNEDKTGHLLVEIKSRLVATGFWRVRGSGDGISFQLMGQTAGVGGSFDVFVNAQPWVLSGNWWLGAAGTISRSLAWMVLEEIASGRTLTIQRANDSGGVANGSWLSGMRFSLGGVATSGANATTPPAQVGTNVTLMGLQNLGVDLTTAAHQFWLQVGVTDALAAGSVAPFWAAWTNRTNGAKTFGLVYEALTDAVTGDPHPLVIGVGGWTLFTDCFGSAARFYGGATLAARSLAGYPAHNIVFPSASPGSYSQPIAADGYWRSFPPWVTDSAYNLHGRCANLLIHPINRDYPTTYNVATPQAKLALGQLLVPWAQGVAPGSSP